MVGLRGSCTTHGGAPTDHRLATRFRFVILYDYAFSSNAPLTSSPVLCMANAAPRVDGCPLLRVPVHLNVPCDFDPGYVSVPLQLCCPRLTDSWSRAVFSLDGPVPYVYWRGPCSCARCLGRLRTPLPLSDRCYLPRRHRQWLRIHPLHTSRPFRPTDTPCS